MKRTRIVMTGVLAACVTMAGAGCSSQSSGLVAEEKFDTPLENIPSESGGTIIEEAPAIVEEPAPACEAELDEWADEYPNIDIEAVETYLEEQNCSYNEEELYNLLADINDNGEPVHTSSALPWWLFLAAKARPATGVTPTAPSSGESSRSSGLSTSAKAKTGFGTGTTASGS